MFSTNIYNLSDNACNILHNLLKSILLYKNINNKTLNNNLKKQRMKDILLYFLNDENIDILNKKKLLKDELIKKNMNIKLINKMLLCIENKNISYFVNKCFNEEKYIIIKNIINLENIFNILCSKFYLNILLDFFREEFQIGIGLKNENFYLKNLQKCIDIDNLNNEYNIINKTYTNEFIKYLLNKSFDKTNLQNFFINIIDTINKLQNKININLNNIKYIYDKFYIGLKREKKSERINGYFQENPKVELINKLVNIFEYIYNILNDLNINKIKKNISSKINYLKNNKKKINLYKSLYTNLKNNYKIFNKFSKNLKNKLDKIIFNIFIKINEHNFKYYNNTIKYIDLYKYSYNINDIYYFLYDNISLFISNLINLKNKKLLEFIVNKITKILLNQNNKLYEFIFIKDTTKIFLNNLFYNIMNIYKNNNFDNTLWYKLKNKCKNINSVNKKKIKNIKLIKKIKKHINIKTYLIVKYLNYIKKFEKIEKNNINEILKFIKLYYKFDNYNFIKKNKNNYTYKKTIIFNDINNLNNKYKIIKNNKTFPNNLNRVNNNKYIFTINVCDIKLDILNKDMYYQNLNINNFNDLNNIYNKIVKLENIILENKCKNIKNIKKYLNNCIEIYNKFLNKNIINNLINDYDIFKSRNLYRSK